jgi:hypothetical protein
MNKELLFKGLQRLFVALVMAFTGPVIYSSSLKNEEHPLFILGLKELLYSLKVSLMKTKVCTCSCLQSYYLCQDYFQI